MDNLHSILTIVIYTGVFAVMVYSIIQEYKKHKQAIKDDARDELREEWKQQNVREALDHEEEFARYCLMRDANKINF